MFVVDGFVQVVLELVLGSRKLHVVEARRPEADLHRTAWLPELQYSQIEVSPVAVFVDLQRARYLAHAR